MKLRTKLSFKILLGVVLVLVAGGLTVVLENLLAMRNPVSVLPTMRIEYMGRELDEKYTMMDSYSWRFLSVVQDWSAEDRSAWRYFEAAPVQPGQSLNISFSQSPQEVKISRATNESSLFDEVSRMTDADVAAGVFPLETPREAGVYTYMVEASWGGSGSVLYYFRLKVL